MTGMTTLLVLIGISAVTANLMKLISWLDQPNAKRSRRAAVR